jgi:predicted amidophosphoribosyltransferase
MFGWGTIFCVLCDHHVSKSEAVPLAGRKDVAVCFGCRDKWQQAGGICGRCKAPVGTDDEVGIFLDRYALGHHECGAAALAGGQRVHA